MKKIAFTALGLSASLLAAPAGATSLTALGPTPATAAPAAFVFNNQQHFNYLTTSGGIHDTWYDGASGRWQGQDISTATTALPGASPQASIFGSQQHVAWMNVDYQIDDSFYANGSRSTQWVDPLGVGFADPSRGFNVADFIGKQQHFAYLDSSGTIVDRYYDSAKSSWFTQSINGPGGTTGFVHVAAMAPAVIELDAPNVQSMHYTYFVRELGGARFIDDAFTIRNGVGTWSEFDSLTSRRILPPPMMGKDGPAFSIVTSVNTGSQLHATYVSEPSGNAVGGDLIDLWSNDLGSSWAEQTVNLNTPVAPSNVVGRPSVWTSGTQQHFTYRTAFGTIWDSWYDNSTGGWRIQQINGFGGNCPDVTDEVLSDPTGSVYNGQQHIAFVVSMPSRGNILVDCWYNGSGWQSQWLN